MNRFPTVIIQKQPPVFDWRPHRLCGERGIVLAVLCIPLSARRGALASSNGVLAHCVFMCRPSYLEQVRLSVRTQKNREDIAVPACGERGIVLAVLCIPLAARRVALAKSDAAAAPQPAALYTDLM